jgi:D-alanyl-D-alanine carboxypeptidase
MSIPAFREIVSKRSYIPDGGGPPKLGGNFLLGRYGVMGGKTGYTDAAGGNFVFAARARVGGTNLMFLGAVMGQRTSSAAGAVGASRDLLAMAGNSLTSVTLARADARVGQISDGLGGITPVKAGSPITLVGWPGLKVPIVIEGNAPRTGAQGSRIGTVKAGPSRFPLVLGQELKEPSFYKRLTRFG